MEPVLRLTNRKRKERKLQKNYTYSSAISTSLSPPRLVRSNVASRADLEAEAVSAVDVSSWSAASGTV